MTKVMVDRHGRRMSVRALMPALAALVLARMPTAAAQAAITPQRVA
jgi:hypothetical protein